MYKIIPSNRFKKSVSKMDKKDRDTILNAINQLINNPRHPALKTKKHQKTKDFESYASHRLRILWNWMEGKILLIDAGDHKLIE